jgi:hypothetical protein
MHEVLVWLLHIWQMLDIGHWTLDVGRWSLLGGDSVGRC